MVSVKHQAEVAKGANITQKNAVKGAKLTTIFDKLERKACSKKSCHKGPESQLASIQDKFLLYILKMCETGMTVNYVLVLFKAASFFAEAFAQSPTTCSTS